MLTDPSNDFTYHPRSGGLNFQGLVDGSGQFVLTHSQFSLWLLLQRETLREEGDKFFGGFACNGGVDNDESSFGGLEGEEGLCGWMDTFRWTVFEKVSKFFISFCTLATVVLSSSNSLSWKRP